MTGIDSDSTHVDLALSLRARHGLERVDFIVGDVADVLADTGGSVDAIHDDAWFAATPSHLETMLALLRPGGLLTMPNWFLLVDALSGRPRNDWEQFAGPAWADDCRAYAEQLAARRHQRLVDRPAAPRSRNQTLMTQLECSGAQLASGAVLDLQRRNGRADSGADRPRREEGTDS